MRCGVGGKIYVLHTSEAIEQEQTTEIRKELNAKKENWLWRHWKKQGNACKLENVLRFLTSGVMCFVEFYKLRKKKKNPNWSPRRKQGFLSLSSSGALFVV